MPGLPLASFMAVDNAVGDDLTPSEKMAVVQSSNGEAVDSIVNAKATAGYKNASQTAQTLSQQSVHEQEEYWRSLSLAQQNLLNSVGYRSPLHAVSTVAKPEGMLGRIWQFAGHAAVAAGRNVEGVGKAGWQVGQDVQHAVRALPQAVSEAGSTMTQGAQGGPGGELGAIGGGAVAGFGNTLQGVGHVLGKVPALAAPGHIIGTIANLGYGEQQRLQRTVGIESAQGPMGSPLSALLHLTDVHSWAQSYDEANNAHYVVAPVKAFVLKMLGGNPQLYQIALMMASGTSQADIYKALMGEGKATVPLQPNGAEQPTMITPMAYYYTVLQADPTFQTAVAALQDGQADLGRVWSETELFTYNSAGQITGMNFNPAQSGWERGIYQLVSGAIDAGADWYGNPVLGLGKIRDGAMLSKYMMQDGESLRIAAQSTPSIMAKVDQWSDDLKNIARAERLHDPRDLTLLTEMARARVEPTREGILDWFSSQAGENALLNGRAGRYYKNKLLWPHITQTQRFGQLVKGGVRDVLDNIANGHADFIDADEATPTDIAKTTGQLPADMTAQEASMPQGVAWAQRNRAMLAPVARLSNKLVNLNIEHPYIDIGADNDIVTFSRYARLYLPPGRADELINNFAHTFDTGERYKQVKGLIAETFAACGADLTPGGRTLMSEYLSDWDQHYSSLKGNDRIGDTAAGLELNQMSTRVALPDARKLLEVSKKDLFWNKADGFIDSDLANSFMSKWWKPAMLFRMGFGIRVAGEELAAAIFRDGMANLLMARGALSARDRVLRAILDQSDPKMVSFFESMNGVLPESELKQLIEEAKSWRGVHDPAVVEKTFFGRVWRTWTAKVVRQQMMNYAVIAGVSRIVPEEMLATAFRLIDDPDGRLLGGMSGHLAGYGDQVGDLRNVASVGKGARRLEFSLGQPGLVTRPGDADDIAHNWQKRSEWNASYSYALNGFRHNAPLSRIMLRTLANGGTDENAIDAGSKYILEEYQKPTSWVNSAMRSKMMPDGEIVGIGARPEAMAEDWALRRMRDLKHLFYDQDGNPLTLGADWTDQSKTLFSKKGELGPMENAGRTLVDMVDKGSLPDNDELMTLPAESMPQNVVSRQMVFSERNARQAFVNRGMYRMVGQPLHYISREPLWLLHVHQGYQDALSRLGSRLGAVTDDHALDSLISHGGVEGVGATARVHKLSTGDYEIGQLINAGDRGTGAGGRLLQQITDAADQQGVTLRLRAASDADVFDARTDRLVHFYEDHGFYPASDQSGVGYLMIRSPQPYVEGLSSTALSKTAMELAKERADTEIAPFIHNPQLRSQFSIMARNISPFWFAQEQQMKRWARTAVMSPELVAKAELTSRGLQSVGFFYRDPDTNDLEFNYPGTGYIGAFMQELFNHGYVLPVNLNLTGDVSSLIPGLNRVGVPTIGPYVSFALDVLPKLDPKFTAFNDAIQGPQQSGESPWEQFVPSIVTRLWETLGGGAAGDIGASGAYLNAELEVAEALTAEGQGLKSNMTPEDVTDFMLRVDRATKSMMLTRAILGFALPASPSINIDPLGLNRDYAEFLNSGMNYNEALAAFLKIHPTGLPYTVAHSESSSGAYVPETSSVLGWLEQYKTPLQQYSYAVPWLIPTRLQNGPFSDETYEYELAQGIRTRTLPDTWANTVIFRQLANTYYYWENYAFNNNLEQAWNVWSQNFKNRYPVFNQYQITSQSHTDRLLAIDDMNNLLKDPTTVALFDTGPMKSTLTDLQALMQAYNNWNTFMVQTKGSTTYDAQRWSETQSFQAWGTAYAAKHADVLSFWNGVLKLEATYSAG